MENYNADGRWHSESGRGDCQSESGESSEENSEWIASIWSTDTSAWSSIEENQWDSLKGIWNSEH